MASLDTLLFMFSMPDFALSSVLNFFCCCQNQGFSSHKSALIKNCVFIHNVNRQLFSEFYSFRKSIPPTVWVERKQSHWTSYCIIRNGSRNSLNSKIELFMAAVSDWSPKPLSQRDPFLIWKSSWIWLWFLLTDKSYNMSYKKYLPQNVVLKNIVKK